MWQDFILTVFEAQRDLHERLIAGFQQVSGDPAAAWWVVGLSFLYGLFHAAGPGHGKVIITTYLATQPAWLARGVLLASLGAMVQGATAIILVYGVVLVVGSLVGYTDLAVDWSERASFALVLCLGLWLLLRGGRSLRGSLTKVSPHHHHGDEHQHHHHDGCCDHHHVADAAQVERSRQGLGAMALVTLSMGLRPCTGAILVLVFASAIGQTALGFFAVLAMSSGTAIAISLLAIVTILARDQIGQFANRHGSANLIGLASATLLIGGGLLLTWFGGSLLYWSFSAPTHPLQL